MTGATRVQHAPLEARIRAWIDRPELPKYLTNLLPFLLGTTLAYWQTGAVDWLVALIALIALFLLTDVIHPAPPINALFGTIGQGLIVFGAYYVQLGFSTLPLIVSVPWLLALPALRVIREFPTYDADRVTGQRGMTVRFGRARMAVVYDVLISLSIFSFGPLYAVVGARTFWVVLLPIFFLARSILESRQGAWLIPAQVKAAAADGFIGTLLIPLSLTAAFLGAAAMTP